MIRENELGLERLETAIVASEIVDANLTPKEREILKLIDLRWDDFERKNNRLMNPDEFENLLNAIPGGQEALDRCTHLQEIYMDELSKDSNVRVGL